MNKRVAEIELNINAVRVNQVEKATQGDTNTHFLHLTFANGVELEGYNLQVTYMPPYPETVPYVDVYTDLKQELDILIPNVLLRRTGKIRVDFALSKEEEILTVNKSFTFEVIKTINGSSITAFPEGNLKLTLAQQIEQIAQLTEQAQEILDEYNKNSEEKTTAFNENARIKTEEFNTNAQTQTTKFNENSNTKTTEFNQNVTTKTNEFNTLVDTSKGEIEKKITEGIDVAVIEANKQVVAQQEKSIQAIQTQGTTEIEKVTAEGDKQVQRVTEEGTKQIGLVDSQGDTSKGIVEQAETKALQSIETAKTGAMQEVNGTKDQIISDITQAKNNAKQEIEDTKSGVVQAVTEEGTKQTGLVTAEGTKQIQVVRDKATEEIEKVNQAGVDTVTSSKQEITQAKNTAISEIETAKNEKIQEIRDIKYTDINTNQKFKDWIGTQKEYDDTTLKTPEIRYNIYDDTTGDTNLKFFRGKYPTSYYDPRIARIIQADNSKLTSWDRLGDMPIKREENKPLDDYIVASGDWGTIYSDGIVTVEQLAPTTNSDYQIALSQLEEIQGSGINLLNEEGYTPFDFNSLTDHKVLIDDINNANVKEINNTEYPIVYTNEETGETTTINKPVLREGTIPIPISFGCLVTSDNKIYTGMGYENYGKTVRKYGLEEPILISNENGISKYKISGTQAYAIGGISYLTYYNSQLTNQDGDFYLSCKVRIKYLDKYITPNVDITNHNNTTTYFRESKDLGNGWYKFSLAYKIPFKTFSIVSFVVFDKEITQGTIVNDGELILEIDDTSFILAKSNVELPIIPQKTIVPNCNLEFTVPVDLVQNSIIVKGIEHMPSTSQASSWLWQSQNNLYIVNKSKNSSLYSNTYKDNNLLQNENYSNNFRLSTSSVNEKNITTFQQLLIYNGDLTQEELEKERDKNIKMYEIYKNE